MIRVAHVITRLCAGGASEALRNLAGARDNSKFDFDLIHGQVAEGETDVTSSVGPHFTRCRFIPSLGRSISPLADLMALKEMIRVLKAGNYDLVHTHTSKAGILGRQASHRAGIPVVHSTHGIIFSPRAGIPGVGTLTRPLFLSMERSAAHLSRRILALSQVEVQEWVNLKVGTPELFEVLPSPLDPTRIRKAMAHRRDLRMQWGLAEAARVHVVAGRLAAEKGHRTAIQAMALGVEGELWIAGDGPLRGELEDLSRRLNVSGKVRFLGHRSDFHDWLPLADALVMPSLYEGQGLVALEAYAARVPVVASRVGGVPEVVEEGVTGLMIPPSDPQALANALGRLARDPSMALSLTAKALPRVDLYAPGRIVGRLQGIYEKVLSH